MSEVTVPDACGYVLWPLSYLKRFGMVHVDFQSQVGTSRDSAWLYGEVIVSNGPSLG